jgi:hypothetical protein
MPTGIMVGIAHPTPLEIGKDKNLNIASAISIKMR